MNGLTVTELHTQDGYDWPNGVGDERWLVGTHQPAAPYFRTQLSSGDAVNFPAMWPGGDLLTPAERVARGMPAIYAWPRDFLAGT